MIHGYNKKALYGKSKNNRHTILFLIGLLYDSMRRGNVNLALYAASQYPKLSTLKKSLLIFACENCPNIHFITNILDLDTTEKSRDSYYKWTYRFCITIKSRIVVNAFRIVSADMEQRKKDLGIDDIKFVYPTLPNRTIDYEVQINPSIDIMDYIDANDLRNAINASKDGTINTNNDSEDVIEDTTMTDVLLDSNIIDVSDLYRFESPYLNDILKQQDCVMPISPKQNTQYIKCITIEEEKTLINNALATYVLLCTNSIYDATNMLYDKASSVYPNLKHHLCKLMCILKKYYLDFTFFILSLASLSYCSNIDVLKLPIPSIFNPPTVIYSSNYVWYALPVNTNTNYYVNYFKYLSFNTITNKTMTDKYGVNKFMRIKEPIVNSIKQLLTYDEKPSMSVIKITEPYGNTPKLGFCSLHKKEPYKYIITLYAYKSPKKIDTILLADYVKKILNLNSLNRRAITYNDEYYILQKNVFTIDTDEIEVVDGCKQCRINISSFYLNDIIHYEDNAELIVKILKQLVYMYMIGNTVIGKYAIIIYNDNIYSLNDALEFKEFENLLFVPSTSKQIENIYIQQLNIHWDTIIEFINESYEIISQDQKLTINLKIMFLHKLLYLKDKSHWKFCNPDLRLPPKMRVLELH